MKCHKTIITMRHQQHPVCYEHIDPKRYEPSLAEDVFMGVIVVCVFGILFLPALLKAF